LTSTTIHSKYMHHVYWYSYVLLRLTVITKRLTTVTLTSRVYFVQPKLKLAMRQLGPIRLCAAGTTYPSAMLFSVKKNTRNRYGIQSAISIETIRTHDPLFSSSIHPGHQDSLLYNHFSRTHPSSISSSIHCGAHLSLYLNISMRDLVLKNLLKQI
jgi:hypothetical protein